ncbi:Uncharacterised protein [Streptococcus pneumoniae]|nr:hypothetical protein [Bacillus paranthracis]CKE55173.1 Uncharacterised protein [Streptococcus pneumoniae]CKE89528.1 Uncharacterised protein [Streptococcus pneumoniae]CKF03052.1 Uncharacterised protein [Bacillus paranthracis]CKF10855.1 Uncharacterised protein [Streptococcus pneumoniae]CKF14588.1 Uncharacterised protein [Streptococcus pneumoniae]
MKTVKDNLNVLLEMALLEVVKIDTEKQNIMNEYVQKQQEIFDLTMLTEEEMHEMMHEEVKDFVDKLEQVKQLLHFFPSDFDREIEMQSVPKFNIQKTIKRLDMVAEELASEIIIELDIEVDKLGVSDDLEGVNRVLNLIDKIVELTDRLLELTAEIEVLLELD